MADDIELDLLDLRVGIDGAVAGPEQADQAPALTGLYNCAVEHRPLAVVTAAHSGDVAETVRWARDRGVPVGVVAAGHGNWPHRGIVINTRALDSVVIDPERRRATVAAGVLWCDLLAAARPHGLIGLAGSMGAVSVVGHVVGGGIGPLVRSFGRTTDWVRRVSVVTGDGRLHTGVSADDDPELFWALLGGKDTVGIVTELEMELIELTHLHGGAVFFDGTDAHAVLHSYLDWARQLPTETTTSIALLRLPDTPGVPEPLRGRTTVHLRYAHVGAPAAGEAQLSEMRQVATPLIDTVGPLAASTLDGVHLDPPGPVPGWDTGAYLTGLDHDAVDRLLAVAGPARELPLAMVELRPLDGVAARARQGCIPARDADWILGVIAPMTPQLRLSVPVVGQELIDAMAPWATGLRPANWGGLDTAATAPGRYWALPDRRRLTAASQRHDPAGILGGPRFGLRR